MNKSNAAILKPGKEKAIRNFHHWIFSGAIQSLPSFKDGDFLDVFSSSGLFLGSGYFNRRSGIIGRMLSFDDTPPLLALEKRLESALKLRKEWLKSDQTTAYRLINGEGDGIPGLVIDIYEQTAVVQCSTKGIDRLKTWIIDWLNRHIRPHTIYEKSLSPSRKEEGMQDEQKFLFGIENPNLFFRENGLLFTANLTTSQKTGFF
ncbi:MAG: class I SAM-dependent rRNA methyltransferase, partial [Parachlamydiaceae bacterium]|nr:class I SAM-dependent rRNA methyltransferase [Parachlamydiaceae bacterium]